MRIPGFDGVVLAGGQSRRMGQDKAFVTVAGQPQYRRSVSALYDAGARNVFVVGGDASSFDLDDATWVADPEPGEGPVQAVVAGIGAASESHVAVLSCDLPLVTGDTLNPLLSIAKETQVAVPLVRGQCEWMSSVWTKDAGQVLEQRFRAGERRLWKAAEGLRTAYLVTLDARLGDADTPDELAAAKRILDGVHGRVAQWQFPRSP